MSDGLVRALLEEQHPDLAGLTLRLVANGWDNVLFRVGDDLVARLPRRELAVPLVEHEQRWLPALAPLLPLPIPAPVRIGRPGAGYPWPWSICPWIEGRSALESPPRDLGATAVLLGRFLAALHTPAPADAPANPYRGVALHGRTDRTLAALDDLGDAVDGPRLRALWEELLELPAWSRPPVWVHGDTHPGNLIVRDGEVVAVVDFGDLTAGDPASDLVVAWMLLTAEHRPAFRRAVGADDDPALWDRGRAWALAIGLSLLASSADNPAYAAMARRTLDEVVSELR